MTRAGASWSGGKDSCLAVWKAIQSGRRVCRLVNFVSEEAGRCCFHGVPAALLRAQAEATGIPFLQQNMPRDMGGYEQRFRETVAALRAEGVEEMVFGDVYMGEHRDWVERVCGEAGAAAWEPLWGLPPARVVEEFLGAGFEAFVVSCKADLFGKEFVGRRVDRGMLDELLARNICPCGERGEFHTLVVDGPLFRSRLQIVEAEPVLGDGFWKHWQMQIREYRVAGKTKRRRVEP